MRGESSSEETCKQNFRAVDTRQDKDIARVRRQTKAATTSQDTYTKIQQTAYKRHQPCPQPTGLRLSPAAGPPRRACSSAPPREGPSAHPASGAKKGGGIKEGKRERERRLFNRESESGRKRNIESIAK